jgi:arylsulfatase A-like enzyme
MPRIRLWPQRLLFVQVLGLALAACGGSSPKKPNVILITLDTTRADYVSCYGVHPDVTPNLDAIAKDGTRFDLAISTAGVTPVSHASILTGLNNQTHKLRVLAAPSGYTLPDDVPTLASVLAKEGYHTVAVHSAFPVSRNFGFKRGFEVFEDLNTEMTRSPDGKRESWDVATFQRRSDETSDLVAKSVTDEEPYFLWIHYWDPHDWVKYPPEEKMPPRDQIFDPQGNPIRPGTALYAAELRYQDEQIGRMFADLERRGLMEDTLVVVTADHGQGLMEHGWAAHRLLYQEQVHVPLIVRAPGAKQKPSVADLVRTIDVYPTILDYAGIAPPKPVDGRSLRALIEGGADEKRIAFGDQINGYDTNAGMAGREDRKYDQFLYMAIDWPMKLIYRPLHPEKSELFDLSKDADEAVNLYESDVANAARMRKTLARAHPWVPGPFESTGAAHDPTAQAALAALGYTAGQTIDPSWQWTCPEHTDEQLAGPSARCPKCKEPPLMIKR